jgi:hypothetical protein
VTVGTPADVLSRLKSVLPARWFPSSGAGPSGAQGPSPFLDGLASGTAAVLSWAYGLIQYVKAQTRIATQTDGWLDITSLDFFGDALPRLPGEQDPVFSARIRANLFVAANTVPAIAAGIQALTGTVPRIVEAWNPATTGVIDGGAGQGMMFLDVDTKATPGRITDPAMRAQLFIDSVLPPAQAIASNPIGFPALDALSFLDTWSAALIDLAPTELQNLTDLYALINRLKLGGVIAWVRIDSSIQ